MPMSNSTSPRAAYSLARISLSSGLFLALAHTAFAQTWPHPDLQRVSTPTGVFGTPGPADHPAVSSTGRYVAFQAVGAMISSDTNGLADVYRKDTTNGTLALASVSNTGVLGNGASTNPSISDDGTRVVFESTASSLVTGLGTSPANQIFLHDFTAGTTVLVSRTPVGAYSNGPSRFPHISADGLYVVFESDASDLMPLPGDTNGATDVFVYDVTIGNVARVSNDHFGGQLPGPSFFPSISGDGTFVSFVTANQYQGFTLPWITAPTGRVVRRNRVANNSYWFESLTTNPAPFATYPLSGYYPEISDDGLVVAFVGFDPNPAPILNQVYRWFIGNPTGPAQTVTGLTTLISTAATGGASNDNAALADIAINANGSRVAYAHLATNIDPAESAANTNYDVFVYETYATTTGTQSRTQRVSVNRKGEEGNGHSGATFVNDGLGIDLRADGDQVAFGSLASNLSLVPTSDTLEDLNGQADAFLRAVMIVYTPLCGTGTSFQPGCPCANNGLLGRGCDNSQATGGAWLGATGRASVTGDTLQLQVHDTTSNTSALFYQGTSVNTPILYGDGMRCIFGTIVRLATKNTVGGEASFPEAGDPSVGSAGAVPVGSTRYYDVWYRTAMRRRSAPPRPST